MTGRDVFFIKKIIEWITNHIDYEDIDELCSELNVDVCWFKQFYEWD